MRKLVLCQVNIKIVALSRFTSSLCEPAFLLTIFHPHAPREHEVEHFRVNHVNYYIVKVKMAESEGNLEESEVEEIQRILDARHAKNTTRK